MKTFSVPSLEIMRFAVQDILTASNEQDEEPGTTERGISTPEDNF